MRILTMASHSMLHLGGLVAATLLLSVAELRANEMVDVVLIDHGMESMHMDLSKSQVKAGTVTFNVTSKSETLIHEFVVVKAGQAVESWPYNDSENKVEEEGLEAVKELEGIEPGKSGTLTVDLEPGTYALFCNLAGHFKGGMVTTLVVTE
ncbi:MAG: cupredoxin domain-containing protein [Hypericibacter sp.]